jgi:low temperature requirement protein LtrA
MEPGRPLPPAREATARVAHRRRRLTGRDPHEAHRASTPLELLYDLTIVVAFGTAANELAHYVAAGRYGVGIAGFTVAAFAVSWGWLNYSWFASAYDSDDWVFRLATMAQMVGVIVMALGLHQAFLSIDRGDGIDIRVMVAGYVVMRASMLFLWWQVSNHDPPRRRTAHAYMTALAIAQAAWVAVAIAQPPLAATFTLFAVLAVVELAGPAIAERRAPTPWHAHHIAERYGLLVIITLGEGIIGTVASLNAVVHGAHGWTVDAALVVTAGIGLIFGSWWMYFALPWPDILHRNRRAAFPFGYGHLVVFASLAAMGGGLHVAALYLQGATTIGETATVLSVAVPLAIYTLALYVLYSIVMRTADAFHLTLLAATAGVLVTAVALAAGGVDMAVCLVVLMFAPAVTVVGYEVVGHRHVADAIEQIDR